MLADAVRDLKAAEEGHDDANINAAKIQVGGLAAQVGGLRYQLASREVNRPIASRNFMIVSIDEFLMVIIIVVQRYGSYKDLSVESTCRKYLDALARKIACYYSFDCDCNEPTIGDVLSAKNCPENDGWGFKRAYRDHRLVDPEGFQHIVRKGQRLTEILLPSLYKPDEWSRISQFNYKTTKRVHSGALPRDKDGKQYIIIPHEEFIKADMVRFLKNIGVRGWLFQSPDELDIKDADTISFESM